MDELPYCPKCEIAGALCDYHVREELAGTRLANDDLHKRIAELTDERDIFKRTLDKRDRRIEKLEAAIETHKSETISAPTADPRDYMEVCEELWSVLHEG